MDVSTVSTPPSHSGSTGKRSPLFRLALVAGLAVTVAIVALRGSDTAEPTLVAAAAQSSAQQAPAPEDLVPSGPLTLDADISAREEALIPVGDRLTVVGWDVIAARQDVSGVDSELQLIDAEAREAARVAAGAPDGEFPGPIVDIETGASAESALELISRFPEVEPSSYETPVGAGQIYTLAEDYHVLVLMRPGGTITVSIEGALLDESIDSVFSRLGVMDEALFASALSQSGATV